MMFIRTAGEADLAAIRDLLTTTWHATYDAIYGPEGAAEITREWHAMPALRARLGRPRSEFVVADDGRRLGGAAFAAAAAAPQVVTLFLLYVAPDLQARGIGGELLAEIEASFPEAKTLRLEVERQNAAAIRFFEKHGFASTPEEDGEPRDGAISITVLEKALR